MQEQERRKFNRLGKTNPVNFRFVLSYVINEIIE
jgi:hypothetical protein